MNKMLPILAAFIFAVAFSAKSQIVITEVMYNPPESGTDSLEYIEIYNAGTTALDLKDHYLVFANSTRYTFATNYNFAAGSYVVFAVNADAVKRQFNLSFTPLQWASASGLSNTGTAIKIFNGTNVMQDSVVYASSTAPTGTNGSGSSLILCDYNSDNGSAAANWGASTNSTGKTINGQLLKGSPGAPEICVATPVKWLSFTAKWNNENQAILNWKTDEYHVKAYEVQTSEDGITFNTVSSISSKGNGINTYSHTLGNIAATVLVRIKQTDIDGKSTYSTILPLSAKTGIRIIKVSPNPTSGIITIAADNSLLNKSIRLLNAYGQTLQVINVIANTFTVNLSAYSKGLYILDAGNGQKVQLIKQ